MNSTRLSLEEAWTRFKSFEEYQHDESQELPLVEFVWEWESRLHKAKTAGCEYSSTVLALKLLGKLSTGTVPVPGGKIIKNW